MSKSKGSSFERKIAQAFNDAFRQYYPENGVIIDKPFSRVLHSGAYFGGVNANRAKAVSERIVDYGDISTPKNFPFVIECKFYKTSPTLKALIDQKNSQWDKWLDQVETDAKNSGLQPMLIVKYNLIPEMVFLKGVVLRQTPLFHYKDYKVFPLKTILTKDFYETALKPLILEDDIE